MMPSDNSPFYPSPIQREGLSGKLSQPLRTLPTYPTPSPPERNNGTMIPQKACVCFSCHQISMVPKQALSTYCSHCDEYIFLGDIEVGKKIYKTQIHTRGNVLVKASAFSENLFIECQDLLMEGRISGHFQCHGVCLIKRSQTINGTLRAKHFITSPKTEITLTNSAHVEEARIEGKFTGNIVASKKVTIGRNGTVQGKIITPELRVEEGGRHQGTYTPTSSHEPTNQHKRSNGA